MMRGIALSPATCTNCRLARARNGLPNAGRATDAVLGGWQVAGVYDLDVRDAQERSGIHQRGEYGLWSAAAQTAYAMAIWGAGAR